MNWMFNSNKICIGCLATTKCVLDVFDSNKKYVLNDRVCAISYVLVIGHLSQSSNVYVMCSELDW